MGDRSLKVLFYADDGVVVAGNEDAVQCLLYKMKISAEKFNMSISINKTQSMVISKNPIRCKLAVDSGIIQQVSRFNYLETNISCERNLLEEARTQSIKASRVSGYLRDIVWRNKAMSSQSKTRIYKTCVRPILTYASETRAETSKTKSIMRTTEMKILRTIKGVTLRDRIRSDIRAELGVQDVVRWVRTRKRFSRDLVERMPEDRWAKWAKNQKPNKRRPVGKPPKRWYVRELEFSIGGRSQKRAKCTGLNRTWSY
ncbi:uncharacterized protein LOC123322928 [Coccinella septempunctata]|uniref:uncharacterized protein LOC123307813 n=1 Tax=Coccinella septempunctata TaxID=41139 RepID=UPI001D077EE5|nr:uncharacterized protein LOC123307813 [Coccinella septempunctata]XP_044746761.1 uncharacterized protein LOC123308214 [Coccinella septempunctata]XP_044746959.1 uncharacterized protein LOC123308373 [Coccinella septempunctata]XP_044747186.1 uncharacterized protein LOC123308515 [Coccinella septempunctata]XP_044747294.1 uncharacterized protein LOC123308590 [Coccinella septempunctata]XP_044747402.1 uncharacterized protein LOC123308670 [Coccinella septempunctata]XP_044747691.1 uncharacterized prot